MFAYQNDYYLTSPYFSTQELKMMSRILITDDSAFQRRIISSILDKAGFETIFAVNGSEGLVRAAEDRPDLIVLDLLMPGMDGFEMMKRIREQGLRIPIVILTADIQDSTREKCHELGVAACINKPVKKDELVATVRAILDQRGV